MAYLTYDGLIEAIYDASARPQGWGSTLEQIADYVGGSGAMLAYSDFKRNEGFVITSRLREDLNEVYLKYYTTNPLSEAIGRRRVMTPMLGSMLADPRLIRRSPMHADILHPQGVADQAMLGVGSLLSTNSAGGFSVTLTQRQVEQAPDILAKLARLTPHLSRAVELSLDIARHRDEARRLGSLLDALPTAALLLGQNGRLVQANKPAEALLRKGDGLAMTADRQLRASIQRDDRRLREFIAHAIGSSGGITERYQQAIKLPRPSGLPPYLMIATPLPRSSCFLRELVDDAARVLVQLLDPVDRSQQATSMLRQAFGLTSAESRVAALVGTGLGTPRIAVALGLTVNTVRTHIARCFEKTGVRSQVALARLMASIAHP